MRITIKIGSNVLTRPDGSLDVTRYGVTQREVDDYRARYAGTIGLPADMDPSLVDDCVRAVCASMGA